jgi:hypothetical protein
MAASYLPRTQFVKTEEKQSNGKYRFKFTTNTIYSIGLKKVIENLANLQNYACMPHREKLK